MALLLSVLIAGQASAQSLNPSRLVDLTYPFDETTVYWPNGEGFEYKRTAWGMTPAGYWYSAGQFSCAEHGGTHLDSPIHFAEGRWTVDQIPVQRLAGPLAVIDVSAAAAKDRDYRATAQDVIAWEKANGKIAPGTIVVFRTGWGRYWPDRKQYLGSDVPGDVDHLHFPGVTQEAAQVLVQRKVAGTGIDTASFDYGPEKSFPAHRTVLGANIYILENVANLERVPVKGATLIALPMKIGGGTGAPVRIVAVLP
jgi:kynurenine formamidase